jgi:hypothetical protein
MQAKRLSDYPFYSISLHGPFNLPVHTDPDSAISELVLVTDQGQSLSMQALAPFVHLFKLPSLTQQMNLLEFEHLVTIRQRVVYVPWLGGRLK